MKRARTPWSLRWALMVAALTGDFISISLKTEAPLGTTYRFDLQDRAVKRWLKRNEKLRAKQAREREARLQKAEETMGVEVFDG